MEKLTNRSSQKAMIRLRSVSAYSWTPLIWMINIELSQTVRCATSFCPEKIYKRRFNHEECIIYTVQCRWWSLCTRRSKKCREVTRLKENNALQVRTVQAQGNILVSDEHQKHEQESGCHWTEMIWRKTEWRLQLQLIINCQAKKKVIHSNIFFGPPLVLIMEHIWCVIGCNSI